MVVAVRNEPKRLLVQGPAVETVPIIAKRSGNGELRISRLERADNFRRIPPEEFQLESREGAHEFDERGNEQLQADALGERQPEWCMQTFLDGSGKVPGGQRTFMAAREQRHHLVAKVGEVGIGALAPEQRPPPIPPRAS